MMDVNAEDLCCRQESDEAVERVLAVEVLHLMRSPGAYSISVGDMLGGSEVWQAYKHQKHDLFLPAAGDRSVCHHVTPLAGAVEYSDAVAPTNACWA